MKNEIICKVDGCSRVATYKSDQVCQKHYFRMMRYGTYDLIRKGKAKLNQVTPNGYMKVYKPEHQLSDKNGYVFEHRFVLFESIGYGNHTCDNCGKVWNWNGKFDHVDHIDKNKLNNKIENLRPLCNRCNSRRTKIDNTKRKGAFNITWNGETKCVSDWAKDERVFVERYIISNRIKSGWSVEDALTRPVRKKKRLGL